LIRRPLEASSGLHFPVRAMTIRHKPIAIYYGHPEWFRLLFEGLDRRRGASDRLGARRRGIF